MKYVRFYNLRSYDRINTNAAMAKVEQKAGVSYDNARKGYDQQYGQGAESQQQGYAGEVQGNANAYNQYQEAAQQIRQETSGESATGRWDSVAECYMLNGPDIRSVPWDGDAQSEMDAFVSEELYIHSKLMIVDDRTVLCGSANMNDRSQLGYHDSEIAMVIEDNQEIDSHMAGRPHKAKLYAATLRRQIFRKHLGLLQPQDYERADANSTPVGQPNFYDWNSPADRAVTDPLSPQFDALWKGTAATNTAAFAKIFHPVPDDSVRNWKQYDEYYSRFFHTEEAKKEGKDTQKPSSWKWGHVVAESFSPGEQGLKEVKDLLSTIKGNLVEMPLLFLKEEDIAKEGLGLNSFTEAVYT
jgi:phospholipase D1/2